MKKLFSLLAMAAMVFTACQNDEGVKNPTLADEGIVNLSVGVPELATRALDGDNQSGADSAYGAIDYANYTKFLESDYDVRFQLAVYEAGAAEDAEPVYTEVKYVDFASTVNFNDLRFVPGREYQFVFFADFVPQGTQEDFRYNTADLRNITAFEALNAMDETYDAYFFNKTFKVEAGKINEFEAVLKRPFGKIRVLTTDLAWVENYAVPAEGEVTFYNHAIYKSFNAVTGEVTTEAANAEETLRYAIDTNYYGATQYEGKEACTLFATYILGKNAQEAVNFRLDTFEADGSLIKSLDFNTEIPYQRNHLTTLVGNLLTNEADLFVRIDDNFDAEEFVKGDFDNVENNDLGYIRQGELVAGQVYEYETNLFTFQLLSETDGTELREGTYEYTEEVAYLQNATGFRINNGIDVEKGTLTIEKRNTRAAGDSYYVVFDIYATINGKTENYILPWTGVLKAPRTQLAEPVVNYEVDEVDALYITFSWEAVEGAKNYTVEWNGEKQTVEGTSATFDFSGEDTYATAYVTANPELTWSYEASTGSVTVDWKKPIIYREVTVLLGYHDGEAVQFYTDGVKINLNKYPSLEEAVLILDGETTVFSNEATIEVSATGVVITEPALATKFIYTGSMEIYKLDNAKVNWGANAVEIAFTGEDAAITVATSVPLAEGLYPVDPSYVMVEGTTPNVDNITATMNVILKNGVYTVFFNVAVTSSIQKGMQYVGKIDFEKPYTPDYKLTNCEAKAETILFTNEDGVVFEIEGTELKSGDVAVKVYNLGAGDQADAVQTAVAEVTVDEKGEYDVRFTVTAQVFGPVIEKKLQYVGPFKAYEAPVEPEEATEFEATYENVEGLAVFTGIEYDYKIFVNNLATVEYDGTQADGWGARSLKFPAGEGFYSFNHGDKLTVDGYNVTLEFVGWNGSKMRMVASTAPATQEPEDITVELAKDGDTYVGGNYQIYYENEYNYTIFVTNHKDGDLPATVKTSTVVDADGKLVFEFFDEYNYANVTATFTPATEVEVQLTLDGEIYKGLYETTIYSLFGLDNGNALLNIDYAEGEPVRNQMVTFTETKEVITFTFKDDKNKVDVTAIYQKVYDPVVNPTVVNFTTISEPTDLSYYKKFNLADDNGNYVSLLVDANDVSGNNIKAGKYTWVSSTQNLNATYFSFVNKSLVINGAQYANADISGNMVVANDGKITMDIVVAEAEYTLIYTPSAVTPGPGTDEPVEDWTNVTETAELGKVGSFTVYKSATYQLAGGDWQEIGNISNAGKYETEETATGYIFTFDDEANFRHVTITYTEETADDTVVYDPWACTASNVSGNPGTGYSVTLTGDNGDVIVLTGVKFNVWGASSATLNDNAVEFTGNGAMIDTNNGGYVKVDITIGNTTYKGTSKNSIA